MYSILITSSTLDIKLQKRWFAAQDLWVTITETRVMGLSCSVVCVILRIAVLIQYRSVTDTHTHTQTHDDGKYRA